MSTAVDRPRRGSSESFGTLWYSRCPVPTATSVAVAQDLFAAEFGGDGITVLSLHDSSDPAVRLSHYTNDRVLMFREGGIVPPLWARDRGASTTLLGLAWIDQFQGLIALRDSGIRSASDLRFRRIGLPRRVGQPIDFPRAVQSFGIRSTLASGGLSEADVVFVDIETTEPFLANRGDSAAGSLYTAWENTRAQTAELLALVRREVDAIYTSGGYGLQIAALIDAVPVAETSSRPPGCEWAGNHLRMLTVSTELLDRRADLVTRYLATLIRAADWASAHESEAWRVIAAETGLSDEWARLGYHRELPQRLRPKLDAALIDELGRRAAYLAEQGVVGGDVDIDQWVDSSPLGTALALAEEDET
jgi:ABC-type nitrate/sulfonate/bicarbonate transport system substrate-binding protein